MKPVLCALGALAAAAGAASAQNNQLSAQSAVVQSVSANDMIAILQSAGLQAALVHEDGDGTKTIEAAAEGSTVYVALRACAGAGAAAPCALVQPFGFFNGQGVTLGQVNEFNINVSGISTAGLLNDNRGVMAMKMYLNGGVSAENLFYSLAVFFSDISRLLGAIKPGVVAQISYEPTAAAAGAGVDLPAGDYRVNATGAAAAGLMTPQIRAALETGGKIRN
jgi:hypothetical protein